MPPVELSQLTILNLVAIVSYTLAMLFHVIAFTTDNWSYLTLEGVQWKMGLWRGCRHVEADDSWNCTVDVFQDKVFQTGSDWHSGSQVIMTFALILLFLLEFAIIIYACIKKFERHRDRVVGCVLALSLTAGFCHFLVVVMYGSEVGKVPGSWVSSSYALVVICLLLEVTIPVIILFDKSKRFPEDRIYILTGKPKPKPQPTFSLDTAKPPVESHGRHVSMVTKGPETLRKFAPYVIDDHASAIRETSRGLGNSTGSLPDGRRASSGSWASQQTQSTMFTNVSFQPDSSERGSVESMV